LEEAASALHRPVSEEIEYRLEQSFAVPDLVDGVIKDTLSALFGRERIVELCQRIALSIKEQERIIGKKFEEDYLTSWECKQAILAIIDATFMAKEPPSDEMYDLPDGSRRVPTGHILGPLNATRADLPKVIATRTRVERKIQDK
jgi:hypothetical protein